MNGMRMAVTPPDEIVFREHQLMEMDARIARTARACCEEIEKGAPVTAVDAHVILLEGLFHSRALILDQLKYAGGRVTEAYERRRREAADRAAERSERRGSEKDVDSGV